MSSPWLTIIGLGEDGPDGLSAASRLALSQADIVAGAARHLALLGRLETETLVWPVPFSDGLPLILALRGRRVVVLSSGDPFWFGAGAVLAVLLEPGEWRAYPAVSSFGWAASRLGWRLEEVACLGLHAASMAQIRPHLSHQARCLVTLRDGSSVAELAALLTNLGFGASSLWVMECLGGPRERIRNTQADAVDFGDIQAPVMLGIVVAGEGVAMPLASGLPDGFFEHDGQITKRPVRALTLSALAPKPGELLWDIGAGSGSVSIEWLLAHPAMRAVAIEADRDRAERIGRNAVAMGIDRLRVVLGQAPAALAGLPPPDAVFIGGGVSQALLDTVWQMVLPGTRLVANAVTLEAEALFTAWHGQVGGSLLRIELAEAGALGSKRGWRSALPVVQWSVTR